MIRHARALDLAALRLDFGLTPDEQAALEAHLLGCGTCRVETSKFEQDALWLRRLPPIPPPDWVARAVGRRRRPTITLLLAASLLIGGAVGVATFVGSARDHATAVRPSIAPALPSVAAATTPVVPRPNALPRLAGWTLGRDMLDARFSHTATRLLDGSVLIAGGQGVSGTLASAELYDPASDSFDPVEPMRSSRIGATATLLQSGLVLEAGGLASVAEIFDPVSRTWSPTGAMVVRRLAHAAVLLGDGRVLVTGGNSGSGALQSAEIFDPVTGRWHLVGRMAVGRTSHTATLLPDGRVLVAGGEVMAGLGAVTDAVEIFDPVTETFTMAAPMPEPRGRHQATLLADGRVLLVGGVAGGEVLATAALYDPLSGSWTAAPDIRERREAFTLTALPGDRLLIVGGYSQRTATAEVWDPSSGQWAMIDPTFSIRGHHSATLLLDGRVLVCGGVDGDEQRISSSELWLGAQ